MEVSDGERRYMHHYNAPGYTLVKSNVWGAQDAAKLVTASWLSAHFCQCCQKEEDFPYAIRSVTEIMSQNGSTSMAATCSSCLALMDAGVPISAPVSGVAMGLMVDGDKHYILTDIADAEDFAGDMDFKSAGTSKGVHGAPNGHEGPWATCYHSEGSTVGRTKGRAHILEHMLTTLAEPRKALSPFAPRIEKIKINPEKIGAVIGKGGEVINKITAETGAEIDIKDDGLITVAATDAAKIELAINWIRA